jgi:hypothetical protein
MEIILNIRKKPNSEKELNPAQYPKTIIYKKKTNDKKNKNKN